MPNTNPQAIAISNGKLRPTADRFGQLYHLSRALKAEYIAENWASLFPNNSEVLVDGSATDGRTPITNADINTFMTTIDTFVTFFEANTSVVLNNVLKIAVNPERL